MMSAMSEAVELLHCCLDIPYKEIGDIIEQETKDGALAGNFLWSISPQLLRATEANGIKNSDGVLNNMEDSRSLSSRLTCCHGSLTLEDAEVVQDASRSFPPFFDSSIAELQHIWIDGAEGTCV